MLQEMDQAIFLNDLSETFHKTGLEIKSLKRIAFGQKKIIIFLLLRKKQPLKKFYLVKSDLFTKSNC